MGGCLHGHRILYSLVLCFTRLRPCTLLSCSNRSQWSTPYIWDTTQKLRMGHSSTPPRLTSCDLDLEYDDEASVDITKLGASSCAQILIID